MESLCSDIFSRYEQQMFVNQNYLASEFFESSLWDSHFITALESSRPPAHRFARLTQAGRVTLRSALGIPSAKVMFAEFIGVLAPLTFQPLFFYHMRSSSRRPEHFDEMQEMLIVQLANAFSRHAGCLPSRFHTELALAMLNVDPDISMDRWDDLTLLTWDCKPNFTRDAVQAYAVIMFSRDLWWPTNVVLVVPQEQVQAVSSAVDRALWFVGWGILSVGSKSL